MKTEVVQPLVPTLKTTSSVAGSQRSVVASSMAEIKKAGRWTMDEHFRFLEAL